MREFEIFEEIVESGKKNLLKVRKKLNVCADFKSRGFQHF